MPKTEKRSDPLLNYDYSVRMEKPDALSIQCTYCGKENKVNPIRMRDLILCNFCNDILFELDYTLKDIRLTKRFVELYRILIQQLGEMRKMLVQFDKKIKLQYCPDDADFGNIDAESIIPGKYITGVSEIIEKLLNENKISDPDTQKSMEDLFLFIKSYIDNTDSFCRLFNGEKSAAELRNAFSELRGVEKEVNSFVRMTASYLGETAAF